MKTVLITAIAGDIAQGIASIIREVFPGWRLLGMDVHERHGGALYVDKWFQAPKASEPHYNDWLVEVISREKIDICLPMSEAELLYFSKYPNQEFAGATLIMATAKAIEIGSDKLTTSDFLGSIGCERPWTIPAEAFDGDTPLPCIFKPRRSAGSKAIFVCNTRAEIEFHRNHNPPSVLQELLLPADKEVTCAIFRSKDGRTEVLQLLRMLVGGFTGWAQVIEEQEITEQCIQLAEALNLNGSINAQLRLTGNGPRIFEINPRFSSTALMRHRMGFKDVVWSLQDALGETLEFACPAVGTTAVRVQSATILKMATKGMRQ